MRKRGMFERLVRRTGFVLAASLVIMTISILALTLFYWQVEGDQGKNLGLFDWLYFTVITTRTIGFGDITPQTSLGKLGTIFNALLPASVLFGASLVVLEGFFSWLQSQYGRYRMKSVRGHHIIVADEELLESIVQEYALGKRPYICVGTRPLEELPPRLQDHLDDISYSVGDPTRDEVLRAVNIDKADAVVIATADDNINMYVLVTVKGIAPSVKTIVRVNRLETESKFRSVGADVLLPAGTMLGRMLSQAAVSPVALDLVVKLQTGTADPSLVEERVSPDSVGRLVRERFASAVAVYRQDGYHFALDDFHLREGDVVLRIRGEESSVGGRI